MSTVHNTNYSWLYASWLSAHSLFTSQTVYHLRVNWVQVPFSKITQQSSLKTISSPTLPDRYWFMEKTKAEWKTGGGWGGFKSHRSSVYGKQRKIQVTQRAFYELFRGLVNDLSVCLVWLCSLNQYFASWTADEIMGVWSILVSGCVGLSILVYVEATCLGSIRVWSNWRNRRLVFRAPVWAKFSNVKWRVFMQYLRQNKFCLQDVSQRINNLYDNCKVWCNEQQILVNGSLVSNKLQAKQKFWLDWLL